MPIFVALGTATEEGLRHMEALSERHARAVKRAEEAGGKVLASYALFGPYDYLVILECPDEKVALKIVATEAARGHVRYETYAAVPMEEFAKAMEA